MVKGDLSRASIRGISQGNWVHKAQAHKIQVHKVQAHKLQAHKVQAFKAHKVVKISLSMDNVPYQV